MIQYITNPASPVPVAEQVKNVIANGGRWVEIYMPEATDEEIGKVVDEIKPLCIETETFLILSDRVELAKTLNVGGVHLGPHDMLPSKARVYLGAGAVIGVTASSFADVESVKALDIDYISLRPFRDEDGREGLGIEGIKQIVDAMRIAEIEIATVAQGGVTKDDIAALMEAGVNGVIVEC